MRKVFQPMIALSVLAAFSLSAIFCCCAISLHIPSLGNMKAMAADPCQKKAAPQTTHHGYCFVQAPTIDKVPLLSIVSPSWHHFSHWLKAPVSFNHHILQFVSVRTAYGGIFLPQAQSIPLYLQTHSLRL